MTTQELVNSVLEGLHKQDFRSSSAPLSPSTCLYVSHNGDRCAVGVLLTPEEVELVKHSYLNEIDVSGLIEDLDIVRFREHTAALGHFQSWHDEYLQITGGLSRQAVDELRSIVECLLEVELPEFINSIAVEEED